MTETCREHPSPRSSSLDGPGDQFVVSRTGSDRICILHVDDAWRPKQDVPSSGMAAVQSDGVASASLIHYRRAGRRWGMAVRCGREIPVPMPCLFERYWFKIYIDPGVTIRRDAYLGVGGWITKHGIRQMGLYFKISGCWQCLLSSSSVGVLSSTYRCSDGRGSRNQEEFEAAPDRCRSHLGKTSYAHAKK